MKKVIFFDIDGTLIDWVHGQDEISPRVQNAIRELQEQGHYVFIATGRPYAFLSTSILDFGFDGFVLMNGAVIKIKDTIIYQDPIDAHTIKELTSQFDKRKIQYILQGDPYSYIHKDFHKLHTFYENINIANTYLKKEYAIQNIHTYKLEMLCPDEDSIEFCMSLHNDAYDYIYNEDIQFFELYSKKNTKGSGVLKVLEHLNIPVSQSYAFGDAKNDIEMLQTVGCGIAMGNADEEVKACAHYICDSVQHDGVATGIETYIKKDHSIVNQ